MDYTPSKKHIMAMGRGYAKNAHPAWKDLKEKTLAIVRSSNRILQKQSSEGLSTLFIAKQVERLDSCGYVRVSSERNHGNGDRKKPKAIMRCYHRLCPNCQNKMAIALLDQNKKILETWLHSFSALRAKPAFLCLTLTIPNNKPEELGEKITEIMKGFGRLFELKSLDFVKGFLRVLEVAYNAEHGNYHLHIHVLIGVHESYFSNNYLSQERWLTLWKQSVRREDARVADVHRITVKKNSPRAEGLSVKVLAEIIKITNCCAIHSNYVNFNRENNAYDAQDQVLEVFMTHLHGRCLLACGRDFTKVQRELKKI